VCKREAENTYWNDRGAVSTALVTGASSGLGAAIATRLGSDGYDIVLTGRNRDRLAETRTAICSVHPGPHRSIVADLAEDEGIASIVTQTEEIDVLVHSAGIFNPKPFAAVTAQELDDLWKVNVRSPFLLTQALLDRLVPNAVVVFISSISGQVGMAQQSAYSATKGAIDGLMRALAVELAPRGIRVNGVAPGFIASPMNTALRADPAELERRESASLAGRIGTAGEIAGAVSFLVSDSARFIYGITLRVDGGYPTAAVQRNPDALNYSSV
jgi:NAD(P)-dependent dehydrogenase (short-subunit alcohol dehydrogenase family)